MGTQDLYVLKKKFPRNWQEQAGGNSRYHTRESLKFSRAYSLGASERTKLKRLSLRSTHLECFFMSSFGKVDSPCPILLPTPSWYLPCQVWGVPRVAFLQPPLPPLWCNNGLLYLHSSLQFTKSTFRVCYSLSSLRQTCKVDCIVLESKLMESQGLQLFTQVEELVF